MNIRLILVVVHFLFALEMVMAAHRISKVRTKKWSSRRIERTQIAPPANASMKRMDVVELTSYDPKRMKVLALASATVKRTDIAKRKPGKGRRLKLVRPSSAQWRKIKKSKTVTSRIRQRNEKIKKAKRVTAKMRRTKMQKTTFTKRRRTKIPRPWLAKSTGKRTKISRPLPAERRTKKTPTSYPVERSTMKTATPYSDVRRTIKPTTRAPPETRSTAKPRNFTIPHESQCGKDYSYGRDVPEGEAEIETYPWFGLLVFSLKGVITTSPVVLVTKQLVIGAAIEIDNLPKQDFRARAKVVIGQNCSGPKIKVKDYTYHPDYERNTYSSLVLIQLDVFAVQQELRPICPPPKQIYRPDFYAVTLGEDCTYSAIYIHKMTYVEMNECRHFYRRSELDIEGIWPRYTVCAKALQGGSCIWPNGVFLVAKENDRWYLVGFGVKGPGCELPSRFLDYGMYHQWVRGSIERIGIPTVTRMADNQIIVRRRLGSIQRYGPCDAEEKYVEIFTDHTAVIHETGFVKRIAHYNLTILAMYEYSCIILTAEQEIPEKAKIRLKRFCLADRVTCYQSSTLQIDFQVTIEYMTNLHYHVNVFGTELKLLDTKRMNAFFNLYEDYPDIASTWKAGVIWY